VLLTVYNEQETIGKRLDNLLEQNYREGDLEILVASDGSSDNTHAVVERYAARDGRIRLLVGEGMGKSATQNIALPRASGDIVVLTDADTLFHPETIRQLARHFSDRSVGCVSGRLVLGRTDGNVGEGQGFYWRFEMSLRRMESKIGLLHTASGGVMAFRRNLFRPFNAKYGDDCILPLDILQQGYRIVHEDAALAYDSFPASLRGEFRARTRMTLRNITGTLSMYPLLNPLKYPLQTLAIMSHKLLRWLTPFFLLTTFFSNALLLNTHPVFLWAFLFQCLFYLLGTAGLAGELVSVRIPIASVIFSFLLANAGFLLGVLGAVSGRRITSYKRQRSCS
jgi:cellulose synthase/poly-beta-1,6-N-acetylglucosamine synthase-like glycosyltransferase